MDLIRLSLVLLVVIGCQPEALKEVDQELQTFNSFIGESKASTLTLVVEAYDKFLQENYPDIEGSEATKAFLEDVRDNEVGTLLPSTFATEQNNVLREKVENTGLRKEIWIASTEDYDYKLEYGLEDDTVKADYILIEDIEEEIIPIVETGIDSAELENLKKQSKEIILFHTYGKYLQGLKALNSTDNTILGYIEVKELAGSISPSLIAGGLLKSTPKGGFTNSIIKRIVVVELYLKLIMSDSQRKSSG